jgi:hypothetical protein
MKNKFNLTIIFVVFILAAFGCSSSGNQKVSTGYPSAASLASNPLAATPFNPVAKRDFQTKNKSKSATVIAENIGLRQTANQNGKVIQALPQDANVEIIKQKGTWFYVRILGRTGWVQGDAIRIQEDNSADYTAPLLGKSALLRKSRGVSPQTINRTAGGGEASARCADGTLSYSAHRRGTCSHHGGVAEWF